MKKLDFPLLTKDDIEVRIGQMSQDKTKASLLLYKTSRTDADILDKIVGQGNWQKRFYTLQGVGIGDNMRSIVVCSVGIYDEEKHEWIWKDDSGTESNVEQDKGVCSDAFKRASGGSCWGIGRELYSAPTIWVKVESKYDRFEVVSISYDDKRQIKTLEIKNDKGEIVYSYGLKKNVAQTSQNEPKTTTYDQRGSIAKADLEKINAYLDSANDYQRQRFYNWLDKTFQTMNPETLTFIQGERVVLTLTTKGGKV